MNNPLHGIIVLLNYFLTFLTLAIVARALISWFQPNPHHPAVRLLRKITDPILNPLSRLIPPVSGLDFTPIVAIILIQIVQNFLPRLLAY